MWTRLRGMAADAWRRFRAGAEEHRMTRKRARFWEEVRAGEREAEARARPADAEKRLPHPQGKSSKSLKTQP